MTNNQRVDFPLDQQVLRNLKDKRLLVRIRALFQFFKTLNINFSLFWFVIALSLFSTICSAFGYQLFIPFISGLISRDFNVSDKVIGLAHLIPQMKPIYQMFFLFFLVLLVWFLKNISSYFSSLFGTYVAQSLDGSLKKAIVDRYFSFGKRFHDGRGVGFLNNILTDFSTIVAKQVFVVQKFFEKIFGAIVYGMIMAGISWRLTLMSLLFAPFSYYAARGVIGNIRKASIEFARYFDIFTCNTFDLLMSLPLIKNVNKESFEKARFYSNAERFVETRYKADQFGCMIEPVKDMSTIILSLFVAMTLVIVEPTQNSAAAISSYIVFFILLSLAFPGLTAFGDLEIAFATISSQFEILLDNLELKPEWLVSNGIKKFEKMNDKIEFCDVCFRYGEHDFIKNLNFEIKKGEIVALVGQAGAGKTTVTNLLLRHYDLSSGKICIDGVDISEYDVDTLRTRMSVISQMHYFMDASLRENLLYSSQGQIPEDKIAEVVSATGLKDLIDRLPNGYETKVSSRGGTLSGGEQQLLSIARAFLREADIYILDEPTNALDARSFKKAQAAINYLIKGKTTLIIAHHLSTIRRADKIVLLENGQVAEIGTIKELLSRKEKFYAYWNEQQEECFLCKLS